MMAAMSKRLLVIFAVFVVGFGVGYAVTWVVVSGPGPEGIVDADEPPPPLATAPTEDPDAPRPDDPEEREPPALVGEVDLAGLDERVDAGAGGEPVDPEDDETDEVEPEQAATQPWWEACLNRRCRVSFGGIKGGLSVREGRITHGEDVVWADTFQNAARLGVIPVSRQTVVELHAVGMQFGLPSAAHITYRDGATELEGVIALVIGDRLITLVPPKE